jgi:CheY-like chemotaxis protein
MKEGHMTAALLIVGDDPALLETRADLLKAWQVSTTSSKQAVEATRSGVFDLIILCQTLSDKTAGILIEQARERNPALKALAIHISGQKREIEAEPYEIQLQDPGRLLSAVARLLQPSSSHAADQELLSRT